MRIRKFRAWCKKTVNNRISLPINKSFSEFEESEERFRREGRFDEWYENRSKRTDFLMANFDEQFPNTEDVTVTYEMLYDNVSLGANGKIIRPFNYEVLEIMDYVEILDAYEGDLLYSEEYDKSSWCGIIKFNEDNGRIMILDEEYNEWYEVDDFSCGCVRSINKLNME